MCSGLSLTSFSLLPPRSFTRAGTVSPSSASAISSTPAPGPAALFAKSTSLLKYFHIFHEVQSQPKGIGTSEQGKSLGVNIVVNLWAQPLFNKEFPLP